MRRLFERLGRRWAAGTIAELELRVLVLEEWQAGLLAECVGAVALIDQRDAEIAELKADPPPVVVEPTTPEEIADSLERFLWELRMNMLVTNPIGDSQS